MKRLLLNLRGKYLCPRKWHGPMHEGHYVVKGRVHWYHHCLACGRVWDGRYKGVKHV